MKKTGSFSLIERVILSAGAMLIFSVSFQIDQMLEEHGERTEERQTSGRELPYILMPSPLERSFPGMGEAADPHVHAHLRLLLSHFLNILDYLLGTSLKSERKTLKIKNSTRSSLYIVSLTWSAIYNGFLPTTQKAFPRRCAPFSISTAILR